MFRNLSLGTVLVCFSSLAQASGGSITINEVDCDTLSVDTLEFIELYDGGVGNTPLDGLVVVFFNGSSGSSYDVSSFPTDAFDLDGFSTDANGFFLLGNPAVVPTPSIVFAGNGLQNGSDGVALFQGNDTDFPEPTTITSALLGFTLVDAVIYDTNDADLPSLTPLNAFGYGQLNEGANGNKDFHSNQRCIDGGLPWDAALATPGAPNDCTPEHDDCVNADNIFDGAATVNFTTQFSTVSGDVPSCGGMNNDIWFSWSPDQDGPWRFETCDNAAYDTKIAIWSACGGSILGCNDDGPSCTGSTSRVDVSGLLDTDTILIQVGGFSLASVGPGVLSISSLGPPPVPPANDACADATAIIEGINAVNTVNATPSGVMASGLPPYVNEATPNTACNTFGNGDAFAANLHDDVFYTFSPGVNAIYSFATCGQVDFDSKIAIYSGACGALTALACNDDGLDSMAAACGGFTSNLNVSGLIQGQSYTVQLGGFGNGDTGVGTLTVTKESGSSNYCSTAANTVGPGAIMSSSGSVSVTTNNLVIEASGLPADFYLFFYGAAKVNFNPPSFNGQQCVGMPTRLNPIGLAFGGLGARPISMAEIGSPSAGDTLFFQCFYRDNGAIGSAANTSDGLAITFAP